MSKHIHVHLHDAAMPKPPTVKPPTSAAPKAPFRPPSAVIKPAGNAPHNPPKNATPVKPAKASSSVIKGAPHPAIKGINLATKSINLLNKGLRKTGEIAGSRDAGTSEGAKKAAQTRKSHGGGAAQSSGPAYHQAQYEHHQKLATTTTSGSPESQAHYAAAAAHKKAASDPAHAGAAHAASAKVANAGQHFKAKGMYEATPSAAHWEQGLKGIPKGYNPRAGGYSK